jgi:hypothetical protein
MSPPSWKGEQEPLLDWETVGLTGPIAAAVAQAQGLCDFMARMSQEAAARLYARLDAMREQKRQASDFYEELVLEGRQRRQARR